MPIKQEELSELFKDLTKTGHNTVEEVVQLLKDTKLLDMAHKTEDEAVKMFADVNAKKKVTLEQFLAVVTKLKGSVTLSLQARVERERAHVNEVLEAGRRAYYSGRRSSCVVM